MEVPSVPAIVFALLVVLLVGCVGDSSPAVPSSSPTASTAAPLLSRPPAATAASGGISAVPLGIGSYCWQSVCLDAAGPVTGPRELAVASAAPVHVNVPFPMAAAAVSAIEAPGRPQALANGDMVWNFPPVGGQPLPSLMVVGGIAFTAPAAAGSYVVIIFVQAPGGADVSYGLLLEVS